MSSPGASVDFSQVSFINAQLSSYLTSDAFINFG